MNITTVKQLKLKCEYYSSVLTSDNSVHLWGYYDKHEIKSPIECELVKAVEYKIIKPGLIEHFKNRIIKQIFCVEEQIEMFRSIKYEIVKEIELIHCSKSKMFCITKCKRVYYYWTEYGDLRLKWISIDISGIKYICSSYYFTFLVSSDFKIIIFTIFGQISDLKFCFGTKSLIKNSMTRFKSPSISFLLPDVIIYNENSVYELNEDYSLETKYRNPFEYYCDRYGVTFETIELNIKEDLKLIASNTTNYFIKNFITQENNLSIILKPFTIANKIDVLRLSTSNIKLGADIQVR